MKKVLRLVFVFAFCLPLMFLAASCGDGKVVKIELDTSNMKTTYYFDDQNEPQFSSQGLVVKKVFESGTKVDLKANEFELDFSNFDAKTEGNYEIYVKFDSFQEKFEVRVLQKKIVDIGFDTSALPKFYEGDSGLDLRNLKVFEIFNDGERRDAHSNFKTDTTNVAKGSDNKIVKGSYEIMVTLVSNPLISRTFTITVLEREK